MIQKLFDYHVFMYIMLGFCACGILLKVMLDIVYAKLMKASDNMGTAGNKFTQMMKKKFETCYRLKIGVNNVDIFVDKYVYRYKFGGILLSTWENIGVQILMLCLLTGSVGSLLGLIYGCGKEEILTTFSVGVLTSALLILLEGLMNNAGKKEVIRLNMKDYLENFFKVRLEQEAFHPELIEQYKKELLAQGEGELIADKPAGNLNGKEEVHTSERAAQRMTKKQQKETLRQEKKARIAAAREAKEDKKVAKQLAKDRKKEELVQKKSAERTLRERLKKEAELALEKKREEERAQLELRRAEAKAQEERRKEEKYRQEEIKKALLLEKQAVKEDKQKAASGQRTVTEYKTKAQEKKEILMREIQERRMMNQDTQEGEKDLQNEEITEASEKVSMEETAGASVQASVKAPMDQSGTFSGKAPEKNTGAAVSGTAVLEAAASGGAAAGSQSVILPTTKAVQLKPVNRKKQKASDPLEDKLIEDILKEFLA